MSKVKQLSDFYSNRKRIPDIYRTSRAQDVVKTQNDGPPSFSHSINIRFTFIKLSDSFDFDTGH